MKFSSSFRATPSCRGANPVSGVFITTSAGSEGISLHLLSDQTWTRYTRICGLISLTKAISVSDRGRVVSGDTDSLTQTREPSDDDQTLMKASGLQPPSSSRSGTAPSRRTRPKVQSNWLLRRPSLQWAQLIGAWHRRTVWMLRNASRWPQKDGAAPETCRVAYKIKARVCSRNTWEWHWVFF